jgi:pyrroline-5-carboxylate reductase
MTDKTIGFIGGGRITRIILGGLAKAGKMPRNIVVADTSAEALGKLRSEFANITVVQNNGQAAEQDIVFLALHPPVIPDTLKDIKDSLKTGAVLISLAPKPPIAMLSEMLGGFKQIARLLPNAPSIVNKGCNPVVFSPSLSSNEKRN